MHTTNNRTLPLHTIHQLLLLCLLFCLSLPAYALSDMQGNTKKFIDLVGNGKWTVFEVWSSECPACPDAVFYMNNLKKRYQKAELIGVSVDRDYGAKGKQMAQRFIKKHNIMFPNLLSSSVEVDNFLHLHNETFFGTPSVLIFNPQGELRGIEVGAIISQDVIDFIEREESK